MSDISHHLPLPLERALRGFLGVPQGASLEAESVSGGMIHHALRIRAGGSSYFLKWNEQAAPGIFTTEAVGLRLLREVGTVRVPEPLMAADAEGETPGYLLMEWIDTGSGEWGAAMGAGLARLHRLSAERGSPGYGLDSDNYLGSFLHPQGWDPDWVRFFREKRLRPQLELAEAQGYLPPYRRRSIEEIMERLEEWLGGVRRQPALLHGDLWSGNVLVDDSGSPVLVDPAAHYGDREMELAYTRLFGGFPVSFYLSYQAEWPLEPGWEDRQDLYNLFHLVNHLNHFGERYGPRVDAVLRRYVG